VAFEEVGYSADYTWCVNALDGKIEGGGGRGREGGHVGGEREGRGCGR